jgi:hypothetical protein
VLAVYFAPSGIVGVLKADEAKSNWPLRARARRASGSLGQIRSQLSGNHHCSHGLPGGAEGIRTPDLRSAGTHALHSAAASDP